MTASVLAGLAVVLLLVGAGCDGAGGKADATAHDTTVCKAECEGRECGDDGCGGTCGSCAEDQACNPLQRKCIAICRPGCSGRACGDDGCGGSCGYCPDGDTCIRTATTSFCEAAAKDDIVPVDVLEVTGNVEIPGVDIPYDSPGEDVLEPADARDDPDYTEIPRVDLSYDSPGEDVQETAGDGMQPSEVADADVPPSTRRIEFLVDTADPIPVQVKQTYTIRARIVDDSTGKGVKNTAVTFRILTVTDGLGGETLLEWDGSIPRTLEVTDETGRVDGVFQAGESSGLVYSIELSSKDIPSARLVLITHASKVCARLKVSATYAGTVPDAATFLVSVLPGYTKCPDVSAANLPDPVAEAVGLDFAVPAEVDCVPPNETFTVFVTARENCAFASGCIEGVASQAMDETTEATVMLGDVDVSLAGEYTGAHRFILTDLFPDCTGLATPSECATPYGLAFPKLACCYLGAIEGFFKTDAAAFATALKTSSASWSGSKVPAGREGEFEAAVDAAMVEFLAANTPDWVAQYGAVARFVHMAIRSVNLTSTLTLGAMTGGEYPGTTTWTAYTIYWKSACDPNDPATWATCGLCTYPMDRFGGLAYSPALPPSLLTARRGVGNRIDVREHEVALNPGRLLAFIVNDVAANALTGGRIRDGMYKDGLAGNADEAARKWIDCEAVAPVLLAKAGASFTGTRQDLQVLCSSALDQLLAPQTTLLAAVTAASKLAVSGTASWIDANCDLTSDRLVSGAYTGAFVPASGTSIPIAGSFTAARN